jgi:hypothetical protein
LQGPLNRVKDDLSRREMRVHIQGVVYSVPLLSKLTRRRKTGSVSGLDCSPHLSVVTPFLLSREGVDMGAGSVNTAVYFYLV